MAEAEEAFGVEFDALPPPRLAKVEPGDVSPAAAVAACRVDLDRPAAALPPPARRAQAFTLWLRADDFHRRRKEAAAVLENLLADNPHTTLQVVIEPAGDLRRLSAAALESLLAACHASNSYLDWYYSLHPAGLLGAQAAGGRGAGPPPRAEVDRAWIEAVSDCTALVWRDNGEG